MVGFRGDKKSSNPPNLPGTSSSTEFPSPQEKQSRKKSFLHRRAASHQISSPSSLKENSNLSTNDNSALPNQNASPTVQSPFARTHSNSPVSLTNRLLRNYKPFDSPGSSVTPSPTDVPNRLPPHSSAMENNIPKSEKIDSLSKDNDTRSDEDVEKATDKERMDMLNWTIDAAVEDSNDSSSESLVDIAKTVNPDIIPPSSKTESKLEIKSKSILKMSTSPIKKTVEPELENKDNNNNSSDFDIQHERRRSSMESLAWYKRTDDENEITSEIINENEILTPSSSKFPKVRKGFTVRKTGLSNSVLSPIKYKHRNRRRSSSLSVSLDINPEDLSYVAKRTSTLQFKAVINILTNYAKQNAGWSMFIAGIIFIIYTSDTLRKLILSIITGLVIILATSYWKLILKSEEFYNLREYNFLKFSSKSATTESDFFGNKLKFYSRDTVGMAKHWWDDWRTYRKKELLSHNLTYTRSSKIQTHLDKLVRLIIKEFVKSWYLSEISSDPTFLEIINQDLNHVMKILTQRMDSLNTLELIGVRLIPLFTQHITEYDRCVAILQRNSEDVLSATGQSLSVDNLDDFIYSSDKKFKNYSTNNSALTKNPYQHLIHCVCVSPTSAVALSLDTQSNSIIENFYNGNYHAALGGNSGLLNRQKTLPSIKNVSNSKLYESEYWRRVTTVILNIILPTAEVNSRVTTTLLREILVCKIFMPIVDILSNPDTCNRLLNNLTDTLVEKFDIEVVKLKHVVEEQQEFDESLDSSLKKEKNNPIRMSNEDILQSIAGTIASIDDELDISSNDKSPSSQNIPSPSLVKSNNNKNELNELKNKIKKHPSFMKQIKKTDNIVELMRYVDIIKQELNHKVEELKEVNESMFSKDNSKPDPSLIKRQKFLRNYITTLEDTLKKVDKQIVAIDSKDGKKVDNTLEKFLNDPYLTSFFAEFVDQEGYSKDLEFYIIVKTLRQAIKQKLDLELNIEDYTEQMKTKDISSMKEVNEGIQYIVQEYIIANKINSPISTAARDKVEKEAQRLFKLVTNMTKELPSNEEVPTPLSTVSSNTTVSENSNSKNVTRISKTSVLGHRKVISDVLEEDLESPKSKSNVYHNLAEDSISIETKDSKDSNSIDDKSLENDIDGNSISSKATIDNNVTSGLITINCSLESLNASPMTNFVNTRESISILSDLLQVLSDEIYFFMDKRLFFLFVHSPIYKALQEKLKSNVDSKKNGLNVNTKFSPAKSVSTDSVFCSPIISNTSPDTAQIRRFKLELMKGKSFKSIQDLPRIIRPGVLSETISFLGSSFERSLQQSKQQTAASAIEKNRLSSDSSNTLKSDKSNNDEAVLSTDINTLHSVPSSLSLNASKISNNLESTSPNTLASSIATNDIYSPTASIETAASLSPSNSFASNKNLNLKSRSRLMSLVFNSKDDIDYLGDNADRNELTSNDGNGKNLGSHSRKGSIFVNILDQTKNMSQTSSKKIKGIFKQNSRGSVTNGQQILSDYSVPSVSSPSEYLEDEKELKVDAYSSIPTSGNESQVESDLDNVDDDVEFTDLTKSDNTFASDDKSNLTGISLPSTVTPSKIQQCINNEEKYLEDINDLETRLSNAKNNRAPESRLKDLQNEINDLQDKSKNNLELKHSLCKDEWNCFPNKNTTTVKIPSFDLIRMDNKLYAFFLIEVKHANTDGNISTWVVKRKFSDFLILNQTLKKIYSEIGSLEFPSKLIPGLRKFKRDVPSNRRPILETYIQSILSHDKAMKEPCTRLFLLTESMGNHLSSSMNNSVGTNNATSANISRSNSAQSFISDDIIENDKVKESLISTPVATNTSPVKNFLSDFQKDSIPDLSKDTVDTLPKKPRHRSHKSLAFLPKDFTPPLLSNFMSEKSLDKSLDSKSDLNRSSVSSVSSLPKKTHFSKEVIETDNLPKIANNHLNNARKSLHRKGVSSISGLKFFQQREKDKQRDKAPLNAVRSEGNLSSSVDSQTTNKSILNAIPLLNKVSFEDSGVGSVVEVSNTPTNSLLNLLFEVFQLKRKDNWFRGGALTLITQQFFGGRVDKKVTELLNSLINEDAVGKYLSLIMGIINTGDVEPTMKSESPKDKRKEILELEEKLASIVLELIGGFIGKKNTILGVSKVVSVLQHKRLNKQLLYSLLEEVLVALFPELLNKSVKSE